MKPYCGTTIHAKAIEGFFNYAVHFAFEIVFLYCKAPLIIP